jgi:hypothetical protein
MSEVCNQAYYRIMKEYKISNYDNLTEIFPLKEYRAEADVVYQGHVPYLAFIIVAGPVALKKNNRAIRLLSAGHLIGVVELLHQVPSAYTLTFFPGTKVCSLDKSTINELLSGQQHPLSFELKEWLSQFSKAD